MFFNFLIYSGGAAFILIIQTFFSRRLDPNEKSKSALKTDSLAILVFALGFGFFFSVSSELLTDYIDFKIVNIIMLGALISSYWFFVAPSFYLFRKEKYIRDFELEKQLRLEGFKYKVLFSDEISLNAYGTGGLPHVRLIIIANDLRSQLTQTELKTIIYHEIGHHEKKHIIKLFGLNIIMYTLYYLLFDFSLNLTTVLYLELIIVAVVGAIGGLVYYYLPNKILYYLEYEADLFSATHNNKEDVISALIKFDDITEGQLSKGNINHPNLKKRLDNLRRLG